LLDAADQGKFTLKGVNGACGPPAANRNNVLSQRVSKLPETKGDAGYRWVGLERVHRND